MDLLLETLGLAESAKLLSLNPPGWGGNLLRGLANSLQIAFGAFGFGLVIGLFGAYGKLYGGVVVRDLLAIYTTVIRAVPELVLILILYYVGTDLINQVSEAAGYGRVEISGVVAGIWVLGIVQGAYATEVLRGAIQAIPPGQIEAARSYGTLPSDAADHHSGDDGLRDARTGQSVADRDQGYRPAGHCRLQRTDPGNPSGRGQHTGLFYLLPRRRGALHDRDAVLGRGFWPDREMGAARATLAEGYGPMTAWRAMLQPHRIVMMVLFVGLVIWCAVTLRWDWIPQYAPLALEGLWRTIWILIVTCVLGFLLAIPLGLAQAVGPWYLSSPARVFCTVIRGTPLLLQIWLLYYGLGSLFPQIPWIRGSELWPYLRQAWPYAVLALTLSFAGYEGEIMRGAFASVNKGQLEAANAFGMPRFTTFRRIWLPQAIRNVLPTLGGETILQLKATPLVATITVVELYSVSSRVRSDTFIVYEPLILLALSYMVIAGLIALMFRRLEDRVPR